MAKLAYRPFGMLFSVLGGLLAGTVFKQVWKRVSDKEDPPKPKQSEYGWRELLAAAALQGALFGLAKAAIDRGGARTFEKITGSWPGDFGRPTSRRAFAACGPPRCGPTTAAHCLQANAWRSLG